jgi:hypothetical protein
MTNEVTEGKAAARELAARLPGWAVWYGQHTGRFWATPRSVMPGGPRHAEGATAEELEDAIRRATGAPPRQGTPPQEARRPDQSPANQNTRHEPARLRA